MYYYYKPKVKIKEGSAIVDYKSVTQLALASPAAEQQSLFDGEHHENDAADESSVKYLF